MQQLAVAILKTFLRYLQDHDDHDDHHEKTSLGARIGLGFGLTAIAGLFTLSGALIVFCMKKGKHTLAVGVSVALSAGVMIYISFVEIFSESVALFAKYPMDINFAMLYTTVTIFSSILIALIVDFLLSLPCAKRCFKLPHEVSLGGGYDENESRASLESKGANDSATISAPPTDDQVSLEVSSVDEDVPLNKKDMLISGVVTALAVTLHNIPEGTITFFSALNDPSFGVIMCIAMALHNIPEGIGVAALIYHATKSKLYAILATLLSGLAEILGAAIGYGVYVAGGKNDLVLAIALAFSAGIMLFVAIKKMAYLSYKIDAKDKYTSYAIFGGMAVMASSLLLLEFFSPHEHTVV